MYYRKYRCCDLKRSCIMKVSKVHSDEGALKTLFF